MSDELKPCPFCEHHASCVKVSEVMFYVGCNSDKCAAMNGNYPDAATAIKHWNNRTDERAEMQAAIVELRSVLCEMASYANESREKNTPEFMEGLFERVQISSDTLEKTEKWSG